MTIWIVYWRSDYIDEGIELVAVYANKKTAQAYIDDAKALGEGHYEMEYFRLRRLKKGK